MVNFTIMPLSARPEFVEACAAWSYGEWGSQIENSRTLPQVIEDYKKSIQYNNLPETWIAVSAEKPIGMVRLKSTDHPDRPDITPWLGTLFVHPRYRRMGVAATLCHHVEEQARKKGYPNLYLFTGTAEEMYIKMGYQRIGMLRDTTGFRAEGEPLLMKPL